MQNTNLKVLLSESRDDLLAVQEECTKIKDELAVSVFARVSCWCCRGPMSLERLVNLYLHNFTNSPDSPHVSRIFSRVASRFQTILILNCNLLWRMKSMRIVAYSKYHLLALHREQVSSTKIVRICVDSSTARIITDPVIGSLLS